MLIFWQASSRRVQQLDSSKRFHLLTGACSELALAFPASVLVWLSRLSCPVLSHRQSPKAVLGNRFIVVDLSETNLVDVDPHYQDPEETADTARAAATAKTEADAAAAAATAAAAARAARKKANDKLIVSQSPLCCVGAVPSVLPDVRVDGCPVLG